MLEPPTTTQSGTLPQPLYRYIWQTSRPMQLAICLLTGIIAPLSMATLELQRRIVDGALVERDIRLLVLLGAGFLGIIILQGALKYALNMAKGSVVETVARDIRERVIAKAQKPSSGAQVNSGTLVSMLSAETEDMSGFAGDALAVPILTIGTILSVAGYLIWVQPVIALLAIVVYVPQVLLVPFTQHRINRLARLRILLVRDLGHVAARGPQRQGRTSGHSTGSLLIARIYKVRIWIYMHKYFLTALSNFLNSLGPLIVLMMGGYLVITGKTEVGTLVVFISGIQKISDPGDEVVTFYRTISNTAVMYGMIRDKLDVAVPATKQAKKPGRRTRRRK